MLFSCARALPSFLSARNFSSLADSTASRRPSASSGSSASPPVPPSEACTTSVACSSTRTRRRSISSRARARASADAPVPGSVLVGATTSCPPLPPLPPPLLPHSSSSFAMRSSRALTAAVRSATFPISALRFARYLRICSRAFSFMCFLSSVALARCVRSSSRLPLRSSTVARSCVISASDAVALSVCRDSTSSIRRSRSCSTRSCAAEIAARSLSSSAQRASRRPTSSSSSTIFAACRAESVWCSRVRAAAVSSAGLSCLHRASMRAAFSCDRSSRRARICAWATFMATLRRCNSWRSPVASSVASAPSLPMAAASARVTVRLATNSTSSASQSDSRSWSAARSS
mmetsp:Transcript_4026/g.11250  ORF Transcript_4026/g.11250 Transcript_4026/m.11250 type:complete len:347 (+) Transcript_4026:781-1821(+)